MLHVVSTPIGNMGDISERAIETLASAELVVAEDTRRTGALLRKLGISARMLSYNDFNRQKRIPAILEQLKEGRNAALVSDAGTPGISDPGYRLVVAAIDEGIKVSPVPGPSACIAALACCGLPTDRFTFFGWLPKKKSRRDEIIRSVAHTSVFYESPERMHRTLEAMSELVPDYALCICREMTKLHEEFIRGRAGELYLRLKEKRIKGEIVLVLSPKGTGKPFQC